jgi:hypothetical protein
VTYLERFDNGKMAKTGGKSAGDHDRYGQLKSQNQSLFEFKSVDYCGWYFIFL